MDETTKEIAKTTNKALEVADKIGGFLNVVLGDTFKELGGIAYDWARYYRYNNLLTIRDKVQQLHEKRGVQGKVVPIQLDIGIPLIEAASLAEDDNLQQKWARLIANATDPEFHKKLRKSYVTILSSLDPIDAKILDWMDSQGWNNPLGKISVQVIAENTNFSVDDVKISISNLNRLGLVDIGVPTTFGSIGVSASGDDVRFKISSLGGAFLKMCKDNA